MVVAQWLEKPVGKLAIKDVEATTARTSVQVEQHNQHVCEHNLSMHH